MKINKEAKDKGNTPSKKKEKGKKEKRDERVNKYFHFWDKAENSYPWLIVVVVDYLQVFNPYFQVQGFLLFFWWHYFYSWLKILKYSIFYHELFSRSKLKINSVFHQHNFYKERYQSSFPETHFKICAVLANYKSFYLGMRNCNEKQHSFFKDRRLLCSKTEQCYF